MGVCSYGSRQLPRGERPPRTVPALYLSPTCRAPVPDLSRTCPGPVPDLYFTAGLQALNALRNVSNTRTPQEHAAILAWSKSRLHLGDQVRMEQLCRVMELHELEANSVLFRQGDEVHRPHLHSAPYAPPHRTTHTSTLHHPQSLHHMAHIHSTTARALATP